MHINKSFTVHFGLAIEARNQMIETANRHHGDPTQSTGVHMANGPVGVVRQCINGFDGHHWAFKSGHTIEGERHHQKA